MRYYLLLHRAPNGISLTGVKSLITLLSISNSFPMAANFFGFAVRSLPSPRRAFPLQEIVFGNYIQWSLHDIENDKIHILIRHTLSKFYFILFLHLKIFTNIVKKSIDDKLHIFEPALIELSAKRLLLTSDRPKPVIWPRPKPNSVAKMNRIFGRNRISGNCRTFGFDLGRYRNFPITTTNRPVWWRHKMDAFLTESQMNLRV